jgi:RNA polymerase sigma factor (sigma-70 family)
MLGNERSRPIVHASVVTTTLAKAGAEARTPVPAADATFEEFFDLEQRRLFGALCLVTRNRHEAEELAQDAFLRVWERWERVVEMEDPVGYLYRTAMNAYRSRYRRALLALRKPFVPRESRDALLLVEERDTLLRSLGRLTSSQRAAVVLLDLLEFSSEEAARILSSSPGAVRTQASRARSALRRMGGSRND